MTDRGKKSLIINEKYFKHFLDLTTKQKNLTTNSGENCFINLPLLVPNFSELFVSDCIKIFGLYLRAHRIIKKRESLKNYITSS